MKIVIWLLKFDHTKTFLKLLAFISSINDLESSLVQIIYFLSEVIEKSFIIGTFFMENWWCIDSFIALNYSSSSFPWKLIEFDVLLYELSQFNDNGQNVGEILLIDKLSVKVYWTKKTFVSIDMCVDPGKHGGFRRIFNKAWCIFLDPFQCRWVISNS